MLILKSKMNYRAHRMLNNSYRFLPLFDIGKQTVAGRYTRQERGNIEQELQVHTMSVGDTVSSFAMVFLLCFIANVSIVAAILRHCVHYSIYCNGNPQTRLRYVHVLDNRLSAG